MILQTSNYKNAMLAQIEVKEANLTVADKLKEELFALIDGGDKYIIVSFEQVIYVDSSFLGALVSSLKHAIANKADVVVTGLNKDILGLFQLIRLDKAFRIFTSADEAAANNVK